ncbi:unnamed protein product [Rotaria sordida]|uniref:Uncharacterized protein n=1 Tax=Rotaria sordida TaxID=392033 RepID=A0A814UNR1_9BILA|nr:unnamed protein product [Rotaria sordida]
MATSNRINPRLLANIQDESGQMLKPISQYAKEPLVSLEEACRPLKDIIDEELEQNIQIAKINSGSPPDGLTQDESAAIHLYTMEWDVTEKSLYAILNRRLREADRQKLVPWHKYMKLTERQIVWRGVPKDLSDLYPQGKEQIAPPFDLLTPPFDITKTSTNNSSLKPTAQSNISPSTTQSKSSLKATLIPLSMLASSFRRTVIAPDAKWMSKGIIVAGGNEQGSGLNQLSSETSKIYNSRQNLVQSSFSGLKNQPISFQNYEKTLLS